MRAQDQALLLLARQAGLLDPGRDAHVAAVVQAGGVSALVRERVLAAETVSGLLRELAASRFRCDACGATCDYAALATLEQLACPSCRRPLVISRAPSERVTGAHRVSGVQAAVRPSGPQPVARPSASFPAVRPSGAFPVARPTGAHPAVPPARPSDRAPAALRPSDRAPAAGGARRVGSYVLVRELGRGSNGVVWLVEREGVARRFALKLLTHAAAADPTTVERFRREAAVTSRLDHPGIVPVIDLGTEGEVPYLVMAYCPGPTLQDRLRGGPLAPGQAADLVAKLARAVAHAHAAQVLHRDLKPANVILGEEDGAPRVTDFGLARELDGRSSLTQTSDLVGTPYYMAPERFRGGGRDDPRVDVYALGVILYECLTGRRPFEAGTPAELIKRLETTPALPPHVANPAVPEALSAACLRAMALDPGDRHLSADALAADLEPFARPPAAPATAPDAPAPARDPEPFDDAPVAAGLGRMEALALALLVVGLLACAAAAWWAFAGGDVAAAGGPSDGPLAAAPAPRVEPAELPAPAAPTRAPASSSSPSPSAEPAPEPEPAPAAARDARPSPPGAAERVNERRAMVERIRSTYRGLPEAVLDVMERVPRHAFVHAAAAPRAYDDGPLPHHEGQSVSAPGLVAVMTALLDLAPGDKVLEIGTCSGYQAAVLAHLTPRVYSIELLEPLVARARQALAAQGYREVLVRQGDGFHGWPEEAPFDAVLLTCAAPRIPEPLWEQLAPGGRLVMPQGEPGQSHELVVVTKGHDGQPRRRVVMPVSFSVMSGEVQRR